ncbi:hypothetical protein GCM10010916_42520 [Paenibacillus abyssi]|uniref:Uncharacterized protein n=1 Tax=Paenibacillus abyssi TaxID=1340531 RepID=A0A917LGG9_9BACL|nr:hypothetical protein GCM10010916_42520 [Paenibacillus abyssi]
MGRRVQQPAEYVNRIITTPSGLFHASIGRPLFFIIEDRLAGALARLPGPGFCTLPDLSPGAKTAAGLFWKASKTPRIKT